MSKRKVIYLTEGVMAQVKALAAGELNESHNVCGFDGMSVDECASRVIELFLMERAEQRKQHRGRK